MQETYVNGLKEEDVQETVPSGLPTDSVSPTHSVTQRTVPTESTKLEQLNQIPLHKIMPPAPARQESASKINDSFMSEIDDLLNPQLAKLTKEPSKKMQPRHNANSMNTSMASGGLDALGFGSTPYGGGGNARGMSSGSNGMNTS